MLIIFINSVHQECGVYQYGLRLAKALHNIVKYFEVDSYDTYANIVQIYNPDVVVFNYHSSPMSWLNASNIIRSVKSEIPSVKTGGSYAKNYGILHESPTDMFDVYLDIDPDVVNGLPRPLFYHVPTSIKTPELEMFITYNKGPDVPIFGSFGFGFANKGFDKLIKLVNDQYDKAIIKLVIPLGHYCTEAALEETLTHCHSVPRKPGIELLITNEFFDNDDVLYFLQSNTMNIFAYDRMEGRGISSTIDYALSTNVPIAITNSYMFRNIYDDCICVDKHPLEYIKTQLPYLSQFKEKYSEYNIQQKFISYL